ncbi:hypothetical protein DDI_4028 [Dickeya dianthicola RNS04.9]|nr:hypothetical protein DDI_4028 [Dickeya dianthicola RNS04.9]
MDEEWLKNQGRIQENPRTERSGVFLWADKRNKGIDNVD